MLGMISTFCGKNFFLLNCFKFKWDEYEMKVIPAVKCCLRVDSQFIALR